MAITKAEIIAAAIIVISLVIIFIIDSVTPVLYNGEDGTYPVSLYQTITSIATVLCIAICCLHFKRAATIRWRLLILVVFLGSAGAVLSLCLVGPPRWDFAFLMIFGIDTVGMVVFLLLIFTRDKKITVLLALSASSLVLLYIHLGEYVYQTFHYILLCILSLLIYLVLLFVYGKQFSKRWWIVALIILISASAIIVVGILFPIISMIPFYFITSIDACSALFLGLWIIAQKVRHQDTLQDDQYSFLEIAGLPARFTIKEIELATGNFQTPVGEGGSGAVFKGTLEDGSIVAVKRIKGQPSGEAEFRTEITIIASLQHISLVRLLGYCLTKGGDRYLIYPFFENGSLDAWLFKDEKKRALIWIHRYRVATDVAKALAYFHHECHHQILHLDIKPANILLDNNFRALVSDFGISKLLGKDESSVMTRARGTIGYLPPEMLVPNAISTKSDVYSYGMVLLELVGGRRNFETVIDIESQQARKSYFPKVVKEKMMEGKIMEVVDPCLEHEEVREEEVVVLVRVALWCIQENPELRPSTTEVVDMLERRIPVPLPPDSPMFVVNIFNIETQASNSNQP